MKLARYRSPSGIAGVGAVEGDRIVALDLSKGPATLAGLLEDEDPAARAASLLDRPQVLPLEEVTLLPPVDAQEVWAAGVTYKRSRAARVEESDSAASYYEKVYASERPELFFKATPHRVAGPDQPLRIRADSGWNVPEPELTLVLDSRLRLVGFTVGNDMSSRDIEGQNPLYLPQAKIYDQCAGLGPWITLAGAMPPLEQIGIRLVIRRGEAVAFEERTDAGRMARTFEDLVAWLSRDNSFPGGVMLMTGTGIVPDHEFTLRAGDRVEIAIDGIGTLSNPIVQGGR